MYQNLPSLTLFLPVLLIQLPLTHSWGPFTHQYFAKEDAVHGTSTTFVTGGSSPDSVKKLEGALHTFTFASTLYLEAKKNDNTDDLDFALGYGCHLAHDAVGHHLAGFLNPQEDHPLEFAVDTYVHLKLDNSTFGQVTPRQELLIANASTSASSIYPFISTVSLSQVQKSVSNFKKLTTAESIALPLNRWTYSKQLVKDSYCNVTGINGALVNFARATNWSKLACNRWQSLMTKGGVNGTEAQTMVENYINELFANHGQTSC
jgi:hypothetical protein